MIEENKFLLVLGDTDDVCKLQTEFLRIREIGLNFSKSPSIGAVYETYAESAKEYAEEFRASGKKVGVYGTREKAMAYFLKAIDFIDNDFS